MICRVILISSFLTPLRATFFEEDDIVWIAIETSIDLVFALDIIFTFHSAYYNSMDELICGKR